MAESLLMLPRQPFLKLAWGGVHTEIRKDTRLAQAWHTVSEKPVKNILEST